MILTRKQLLSIIFLVVLIFALPLAIFLSQKRQDIRPHAISGQANFLLSADNTSVHVGDNVTVLVSLQLTDPSVRASGADFVLLYDKNLLVPTNVVPAVTGSDPNGKFTDAPIVTKDGNFDNTYNFVRVSEVSRKSNDSLPGGTFSLATVTFSAKSDGAATIKFPDDNSQLQVVGVGGAPVVTSGPTNPPVATQPPASATTVNLALVPSTATVALNGTQAFDLKATFTGAASGQTLDYFKTTVKFDTATLSMPDGQYIDTSMSGFKKIFRVDGPTAANGSGSIVIELGADVPGGGPSTAGPITVAHIVFTGKAATASKNITLDSASQVVDNHSTNLTVTTSSTSYTVSDSSSVTGRAV